MLRTTLSLRTGPESHHTCRLFYILSKEKGTYGDVAIVDEGLQKSSQCAATSTVQKGGGGFNRDTPTVIRSSYFVVSFKRQIYQIEIHYYDIWNIYYDMTIYVTINQINTIITNIN